MFQLRIQAENEAKNMNLNKVCLCFEAFHCIDDNWVSICEPVLSNPINNMSESIIVITFIIYYLLLFYLLRKEKSLFLVKSFNFVPFLLLKSS